ncbi:hypothetical protein EDB51_117117 [Vibrio crassostreae]|uniref:hypothetical protein n=1 Tax=Vibrio crassostreae TaxID=246167 RepID=UPI00104F1E05|nr:hypothetical protein [Vibrio crassostreae]TCN95800.1 hypothetical protein EDB51_117117 [Vibrio crassostreae]CAK2757655.1 Lambda family phage tail tape measure protein [Vibrio crassostreae]CAK3360078.1 Lambda family phage tail tape measure protein [Vibrio crassostreae]CAK3758882.1 Lambda family phage tail tape measure protein [Vibrio crassostreae]
MSNIVTAVKIAVDSGALDAAQSKAGELAETAGVKLPAGLAKAGVAAGAIAAGMAAAYAAADNLANAVETQAQRGYDFQNSLDSGVRPAMVFIAEQFEAMNAQAEQMNDMITLADANWTMGFRNAQNSIKEMWTGFRTGGQTAEELTDRLIEKIARATGATAEEVRAEMQELADAAETLSLRADERRMIGLRRFAMEGSEYRKQLFEQEIKEREAAITLADSEEQAAALRSQLERFQAEQSAFNEHLNEQERLAEEARQTSIENEIKNAEVANMVGVEQLRARHQMEVEALLARKEAGELNALQTEQLRIQVAKKYQAEALAIQDKANADAIKIAEKAATEMSNATSSALSVIDDDLASLYDSIDSLIRVLQLLDGFSALGSGGGFWGIGGAASAGGMSSFGGVSVGTVSVTVQGNTDTVGMKNAAQEGVYGALNGIVKDTMAKESNYGGILNPSSGVHRM